MKTSAEKIKDKVNMVKLIYDCTTKAENGFYIPLTVIKKIADVLYDNGYDKVEVEYDRRIS